MKWHQISYSYKYASWVKRSESAIFNILEGGVRSAKTTFNILSFCRALERLPFDSVNLAGAESIALSRSILGEGGNELGIKHYFGENARECQYKGKDALEITLGKLRHYVLFVGSKNSDSFKSVRGLTITMVLLTEANLAHRTFLEEVVARTLAADPLYRRQFWDLNPTLPTHYVYRDFIDRWVNDARTGKLLGGVNYDTFSLYENPGLTPEQAKQIASQYDPNSAFYKSLILGMRINAAENVYVLYDYSTESNLPKPTQYLIVCDIGVSASATTFLAVGRHENKLYVYDSYYHRNGKASVGLGVKEYEDYAQDLIDFYKRQEVRFGFPAYRLLIDKDISMYRVLERKLQENLIPTSKLSYVIKEKINQRIVNTRNLLYLGKIIIDDSLQVVLDAITNAVYDPKSLEKGELARLDNTSLDFNPIDTLDSLEYAITYFLRLGFK